MSSENIKSYIFKDMQVFLHICHCMKDCKKSTKPINNAIPLKNNFKQCRLRSDVTYCVTCISKWSLNCLH